MKHPPRNIVIDWLNTIWETDLPPSSKLVACCLRRYMNAQNDMAWPSVARITGECGFKSERTTQEHLKTLCSEGWLQVKGKSNSGTIIYQTATPAKFAPPRNDCTTPPQITTNTPANIAPELNKELNNRIKQVEGWQEWIDYRSEIKKKMTPATIKKQLKFLEGKTPVEQQAIIDQSITNGWTGLFEVKNGNTKSGKAGQQYSGRATAAGNAQKLRDRIASDAKAVAKDDRDVR